MLCSYGRYNKRGSAVRCTLLFDLRLGLNELSLHTGWDSGFFGGEPLPWSAFEGKSTQTSPTETWNKLLGFLDGGAMPAQQSILIACYVAYDVY